MRRGTNLIVLGCLALFGCLSNAITRYDLNSGHDLDKFVGGFGFSLLLIFIGRKLNFRDDSPKSLRP